MKHDIPSEHKFHTFPLQRKLALITEAAKNFERYNNLDGSKRFVQFYSYLINDQSETKIPESLPALPTEPSLLKSFIESWLIARERESLEPIMDHHFLTVTQGDGNRTSAPFPVILLLENLRSAFNVGSIIRTAECAGVTEIYYSGVTPGSNHPKLIDTSMGTLSHIPYKRCDNPIDFLVNHRTNGACLVALETGEKSKNVLQSSPPFPLVLIIGNEKNGISKEVLSLVDEIYSIPMFGWKNSLNVGVATGVALFAMRNHFEQKGCESTIK